MFRIYTSLLALALASCALTPKSPEDMRSNPVAKRVCTQLSVEEAAERVRNGWRACHFMGPTGPGQQAVLVGHVPLLIPLRGGAGDYIRVEKSGSRVTVIKGNLSAGNIQLMADVDETPECKAEVTARGGNFAWTSKASEVEYYLQHPGEGCPK